MIPILLPILAQLLGSGLNLVTNAALVKGKDWLQKETGVSLDTPLSAADTLTLQKYQLDNQVALATIHQQEDALSVTLQQLQYADVADARKMQVAALSQEDLFSKRFVYYFAMGILGFCILFALCLFFVAIPESNRDIINILAGAVFTTGFATVVSFFFGSSKTSVQKDATIASAVGAIHANP